ncbi:MAG: MCP four helix bundle domain-containing protein [Proteobacteria bacterium]|nr:MCP four helix bundle domain-containing protein [Pseudomonadota bacterium]
MFARLSLQKKLFFIILLLTLITLAGSLITVWHIRKTQYLYMSRIENNMASLIAAQKMDAALVMQKGLTTYFFLTNAAKWLDQLNDFHSEFMKSLERARETSKDSYARGILNDIESGYLHYTYSRDNVIALYKEGKKDEGAEAHWGVRDQFFKIRKLSETFRDIHEKSITSAMNSYRKASRLVSVFAWIAIPVDALLVFFLIFILYIQVFKPIRELSSGIEPDQATFLSGDEVKTLKKQVNGLIADFGHTREELVASKGQLVQAEKMATVGKLAAGVAHSVRNPLTSVKMRLFSLERSLKLTSAQKEDLEVISAEIRQIDTVLKNFLEFSRPPKLKRQTISPSDVVDMALQLLKYRLESYGTWVTVKRQSRLPMIPVDPEQLKEVLVNLMVNACEAMGDGGRLTIIEGEKTIDPFGGSVVIQVQDNGPGIPEPVQETVFQPFYSSKEEGTGLGLSIANRIIDEHGGMLSLVSKPGNGTIFTIVLPCKDIGNDNNSYCG